LCTTLINIILKWDGILLLNKVITPSFNKMINYFESDTAQLKNYKTKTPITDK